MTETAIGPVAWLVRGAPRSKLWECEAIARSGKGRVTCRASTHLLRKVIALELNESLVKAAVANARRMRGRKTAVLGMAVDATQFSYDEVTVIYMYNPFGREIMETTMRRLGESLPGTPHPLRIAYVNNLNEQPLLDQK